MAVCIRCSNNNDNNIIKDSTYIKGYGFDGFGPTRPVMEAS